ncbi:SDR family NAD(P)-dependent oxidoreductase [Pelagerythrobacter marensis]|uniref:3-beta hydroxysteroid dehydrogenase n=1 Tax=Pelagerythrobacter marensis TaxID=543877 RepID=A0A0G3XBL4_9SPHN|nr:SDR family NAD(P)-dependent oxidoreductase [Pelagerythrobacter marensis]AKM08009.1 3-beta hydroxysteroid dehydrogenase [Pelagerythrobacter marensis]
MAANDPLNGKLVTLTGGSGFFGRHVAQALLERGARLRIASREPGKAYSLKPLANLGQIAFMPCDVRDPAQAAAAVRGADAIVNLVGSFEGDLMKLICGGARNVAVAARDAGAAAMVHVSAIGADAGSPAGYAEAKARSEEEVLHAFPAATILRPSLLFAENGGFVNMLADVIATFPVVPVFAPQAKVQPLFVDDAADAVTAALADPGRHGGKTYEIAGPEAIGMMELHERIADAQERERHLIAMPDALSSLFAALPGTPMNTDQWTMLRQGNTASGALPGLDKLGVQPRPLGLFLDRWMTRYRKHGRFAERTRDAA